MNGYLYSASPLTMAEYRASVGTANTDKKTVSTGSGGASDGMFYLALAALAVLYFIKT